MPFSYRPLWKILIDNDMTKKQLMKAVQISKSSSNRNGSPKNVSLNISAGLCSCIDFDTSDVIERTRSKE